MGGGGNQQKFKEETGPKIARILKEEGVDGVLLTAGWGICHRSAVLVQRSIEEAGIPTIIIAALPPVVRQTGTPEQLLLVFQWALMQVNQIIEKCNTI